MWFRNLPWKQARRSLESGALLGALCLSSLALIDALGLGATLFGALKGGGIAVLAGGVLGLGLGVLNFCFRLFPVWVRLSLWVAFGLCGGLYLAYSLEVFSKLSGKHTQLATLALVASVSLGLSVGLALFSQQPNRNGVPAAVSVKSRWRWVIRGLLLLAEALCLVVDEYAYALTYHSAHVALRWAALLLVVCLATHLIYFTTKRWKLPTWAAWSLRAGALAWILLPIFFLAPQERRLNAQLTSGKFTGISIDLMRAISDLDGDGFAIGVGGGDCAPLDPSINPGQNEIPGNGIDDNCLLGDATTSRELKPAPPPPKTKSPLSIVLITIDTVRADRMSLYGAKRKTTPEIAAWGRSALRFNTAVSAGGMTSLSLSALFRGVYARRLQWAWTAETNRLRLLLEPEKQLKKGEKIAKYYGLPVPDRHETIPELLGRRGMRTVAVVNDGHSQFLEEGMNIARGFDRYVLVEKLKGSRRGDQAVARESIRELKVLAKKSQPFLLWAHFYGPHGYPPRNLKPAFGTTKQDTYDHAVLLADAQVGRLLRQVDRVAKTQNVAVILTSDHGEKFRNGSRGHGGDLSESNLRVPLLIRGPEVEPGVSDEVVSLIDLFPTIMNWTQTPMPGHVEGFDVRHILEKGRPKPALSDTWFLRRRGPTRLDRTAATGSRYRFVRDLFRNSEKLFDIKSDPKGQTNLIDDVEKPHLILAVDRYLEENRRISVRDVSLSELKK